MIKLFSFKKLIKTLVYFFSALGVFFSFKTIKQNFLSNTDLNYDINNLQKSIENYSKNTENPKSNPLIPSFFIYSFSFLSFLFLSNFIYKSFKLKKEIDFFKDNYKEKIEKLEKDIIFLLKTLKKNEELQENLKELKTTLSQEVKKFKTLKSKTNLNSDLKGKLTSVINKPLSIFKEKTEQQKFFYKNSKIIDNMKVVLEANSTVFINNVIRKFKPRRGPLYNVLNKQDDKSHILFFNTIFVGTLSLVLSYALNSDVSSSFINEIHENQFFFCDQDSVFLNILDCTNFDIPYYDKEFNENKTFKINPSLFKQIHDPFKQFGELQIMEFEKDLQDDFNIEFKKIFKN